MARYLVLVDIADEKAPVAFAKSFGELMQVQSVLVAKNLDDAYLQFKAAGLLFGRVQVQKA